MRSSNKNWIWAILAGCILLAAASMRYGALKEKERNLTAGIEQAKEKERNRVAVTDQMMEAVQKNAEKIRELEKKRDTATTEADRQHYQNLLDKERLRGINEYMNQSE